MSNFERVLSDDFFDDLGARTAYDNWVGFGRQVEQAVLAKLAGKEPICYLLGDPKNKPQVLSTEFMSRPNAFSVGAVITPVFAHPMPCVSTTIDKTACVSENAESETQHHLEHLKRYQKWRRGEDKTMSEMGLTPKQIGEALDWLILFAENHIADKCKKVPEGWQLIPSEPTMDMIKAMLATIVTTSKGGVVNPKATLAYVFAAAPKCTGEK